MNRKATAARVVLQGRDWTAPSYRSPWQDERATRFEPTTPAKLAELYRSDREPLWHSIFAAMTFAAGVAILFFAWSLT